MVLTNLIPEEARQARLRRLHVRRWAISVVVGCAALAVFAGLAWLARDESARLRSAVLRIDTDLKLRRAELRETSTEAQRVLVEIERAKALRSKRAWSGMVALVASNMPEGAWLTSLATDPAGPQSGGGAAPAVMATKDAKEHRALTIDAPRKLRINGLTPGAADPYEFVASLDKSGVFSDVELIRSEREPILDGYYFRFELLCQW